MFDQVISRKATKYDILTNWLKSKLENNAEIKTEDLELLLLSLGVEIKHKVKELKIGGI